MLENFRCRDVGSRGVTACSRWWWLGVKRTRDQGVSGPPRMPVDPAPCGTLAEKGTRDQTFWAASGWECRRAPSAQCAHLLHTVSLRATMAMGDHEIIDLTASDDHEIIVIDSDDPEAGPSRKRSKTNGQGSRTREGSQDGANGTDGGDKTRKKRRKIDRKKRRMHTAAGEEEGEVVEVDEGPGEASLEVSREGTDIEDSRREDRLSSKRREKPTSRSLMDRLGDANGRSEPRQEAPRPKKKKKSKRRKEDDNDGPSGTNAIVDIPLGPSAFFVDDKPAEIPDVAKLKATGDSSKPKGEGADPPPLLLPAHVSVSDHNGDAPVQIIAPVVIDSDDDDYIEYLDYDDDRRVSWIPTLYYRQLFSFL